jgi:hypothetical protein
VVQAPSRQHDKQHKSRKVRNTVPMHGKRADGQGHGVELGVNHHGAYCEASQACCEFAKNEYLNSTNTTKLTFYCLFFRKTTTY